MSSTRVIMPKVGMYQEDVCLSEWLKEEGDRVAAGDLLFTLETDKITSDVEAEDEGFLHRLVEADTLVPVGGQVGWIVPTRDEYHELVRERQGAPSVPAESVETVLASTRTPGPAGASSSARGGGAKVSPRARAYAAEHSISDEELASITGTGPGGRVTDKDVRALVGARPTEDAAVRKRLPLRGRRRIIASRMVESLQTAAQLTSILELDVSPLVRWRREHGGVAGYTAIFVKLVAQALGKHPLLNSRIAGNEIELLVEANVGFAVHMRDGLIVPVIHGADQLSLAEVEARVAALTERARAGTLESADVEGGTFTVSNSGSYPVDLTTAILNPPQSGILWVGRIRERAVVVDGELAVRPTVFACLTFDHRVVDGAPAAEFLGTLESLVSGIGAGDLA